MRFLLDVHIATSIARVLTDSGHDVVRASDRYADWSDVLLLDLAVREDRVMITEDRDFSDLIYRDGAAPPPAILYLRFDPTSQPRMAERVLLVLENTIIDGHMVVIQRTSVRSRPLPGESNDNG